MQEYSAVARFYNGTTFGAFHFKTFRGLPGIFVDSDTGYPVSLKTFPLEPGQDFADIKINELIDLFYTPKIVQDDEGILQQDDENPRIPITFTVEPKHKKPRYVEIIRYVRPLKNGQIDSNKGVTFFFQLDYKYHRVKFGYSVCNGDNFSKAIGTEMALYDFKNNPKVFAMESGPNPILKCGVLQQMFTFHPYLLDPECKRQMLNYLNGSGS